MTPEIKRLRAETDRYVAIDAKALAHARADAARLRRALEEALQILEGQSQRPSRIARIRAALAGEGEVCRAEGCTEVASCGLPEGPPIACLEHAIEENTTPAKSKRCTCPCGCDYSAHGDGEECAYCREAQADPTPEKARQP